MSDHTETESATESGAPLLTPIEGRILGSLIEKQATTPETYPLTLNALVLACNQKTSREPVMNLEPGQVGQALRKLEGRGLTRLVMGARADRWEHQAGKALELIPPQLALLTLLLLRGPQTVSELFTRSGRLHPFEDAQQVQYQLGRLETRGHVIKLPRQSGQREERYMHLLYGPVDMSSIAPSRPAASEREAGLLERIEALESRMAELEQRLAMLE